jgi:hypothetical protein
MKIYFVKIPLPKNHYPRIWVMPITQEIYFGQRKISCSNSCMNMFVYSCCVVSNLFFHAIFQIDVNPFSSIFITQELLPKHDYPRIITQELLGNYHHLYCAHTKIPCNKKCWNMFVFQLYACSIHVFTLSSK